MPYFIEASIATELFTVSAPLLVLLGRFHTPSRGYGWDYRGWGVFTRLPAFQFCAIPTGSPGVISRGKNYHAVQGTTYVLEQNGVPIVIDV